MEEAHSKKIQEKARPTISTIYHPHTNPPNWHTQKVGTAHINAPFNIQSVRPFLLFSSSSFCWPSLNLLGLLGFFRRHTKINFPKCWSKKKLSMPSNAKREMLFFLCDFHGTNSKQGKK
jgi:hypothetical protein